MFKDPKMERFGRAATRGRRAASHATPVSSLCFILSTISCWRIPRAEMT